MPRPLCRIDDKDDIVLYQKNKTKVAEAIANGIVSGFNLNNNTPTIKDVFLDIADSYGRKEINELANMGIINGVGDGRFAPHDLIKREDMAIIVRNAIRYITGK